MEYTKLGNTGMDVSRICLGCMGFGDANRWIHKWVLNEENSRPIISKEDDAVTWARSSGQAVSRPPCTFAIDGERWRVGTPERNTRA